MKKNELYESKTPKVYKSNKLNSSNFGDYNHSDYQVYLMLLSKIGNVDKNGKYLQPEELQREHTLSAKEFSEVFNTAPTHCYSILKKAVFKLMKTDIRVERINSTSYTRINVCSKADYIENEGKINIKFTDDIMPYLKQVKERFMVYNLSEIANFQSIYTTRLYELLQEFKETGWMIKTVDQLREAFATGKHYNLYGHFKARTIVPACEEINKYYLIKIRFEEIKTGQSVTAIKFIFKPVIVLNSVNDKTGEVKSRFMKHELTVDKPKVKKLSKVIDIKPSIEPKKDEPIADAKTEKEGLLSSIVSFFRD